MVSLHGLLQGGENGRGSKCLSATSFLSSGQTVAGKRKGQRRLTSMSGLSQEGWETAAKWAL